MGQAAPLQPGCSGSPDNLLCLFLSHLTIHGLGETLNGLLQQFTLEVQVGLRGLSPEVVLSQSQVLAVLRMTLAALKWRELALQPGRELLGYAPLNLGQCSGR